MKKALLRTGVGLAVVFVGLQFHRPARNLGEAEGPDSLVRHHDVPAAIRTVLARSCYDCHSNRTRYPWYAEVQPVRWWLDSHIADGKRHLNLSEFARYSPKRQAEKLDEIVDTVAIAKSMPLPSYLLVHRDAILTPAEINAVADWAEDLRDRIEDR